MSETALSVIIVNINNQLINIMNVYIYIYIYICRKSCNKFSSNFVTSFDDMFLRL